MTEVTPPKVELRPIEALLHYERNVKHHPEAQVNALVRSIKEFGFTTPILIHSSGEIIAGHGRFLAARKLGLKKVPVIILDHLTEAQRIAYRIADNRLAEQAEYVLENIHVELDKLREMDFDLDLTGFDLDAVNDLISAGRETTAVGEISGEGGEVIRDEEIELVPLDRLKPHPKNYRKHPEDQLGHLIESIKQFGVYRNVVAARDLTILTGHALFEAAQRMGLKRLPVKRLEYAPEDTQALKILTNDNELGHFAEIDDRLLSELLREIKAHDPAGLAGTGYNDEMLANLVMITRHDDEIADINQAAEWVGLPDWQPKDKFWRLVISFNTEEVRQEFLNMIGVKKTFRKARTRMAAMHWPEIEPQDVISVRYVDSEAEAQSQENSTPEAEE